METYSNCCGAMVIEGKCADCKENCDRITDEIAEACHDILKKHDAFVEWLKK